MHRYHLYHYLPLSRWAVLTATQLPALANGTNGKSLGRQQSTSNPRRDSTVPAVGYSTCANKQSYGRAPLIWREAHFFQYMASLNPRCPYILFHQGYCSVDKESSFHCKRHILQKYSVVHYMDNPVSKAMETWPVVCRLHVIALDLWSFLDNFLYNIKEDVVALDHDSTNIKGRKCNLLG